ENHIQLVQKGIDFLKNSNTKKVVLSRMEMLEIEKVDVINTLKKILNSYKNAFVYLWFHPHIGLWMGASPEQLISVSQNKFETMALAGTQLYKDATNVIWKDKEKQEQQFVTDYILENIKNSIDVIKVSEAYTVKAGNLLHIRTDISGELKATSSLGNLVASLHPTPAVCGLPKEKAIKFILENEAYHRTYYTGYLGELNIDNSTSLFVNLRCMQLNKNTASIYIGGGITMDSNAKNEWEETVSKAEVMKKVL
ncbi:isochorismate synthase, partial [Lutibacter sp.]|uniref:isochorismate synthase n=1 Tax=Lutibacter sp. TaxID=1925666 RepID=UPI0035681F46